MRVVHSQISIPEKVVRPTKKQLYHQQMVQALRRKQYSDFQQAGKDPEVIAIENEARKLNPDYQAKFRK